MTPLSVLRTLRRDPFGAQLRAMMRLLPAAPRRRLELLLYLNRQASLPLPSRLCPICGHEGAFTWTGNPVRLDGRCPGCDSLERHRLLALWLTENGEALRGRRVLHFAPEEAVAALLRPLAGRYEACDLDPALAPMVIDIERIALPDASIDVAVCFHVLEHVDDATALAELFRILAPGGLALLQVPIVEGWVRSYENPGIRSEEARTIHFGQRDHVRYYGADFRDRVRAAGFALEEVTAEEPFVHRHGLLRGEKLFLARRP